MSKVSVWWLKLGIAIERIKPGNPLQNGRHERMHLTLKKEATKPAAFNFLQQQSRFDDFIEEFNNEQFSWYFFEALFPAICRLSLRLYEAHQAHTCLFCLLNCKRGGC